MMQYLAIPFVGAFIGWLTNIIAIEMLFKPKTSIIFLELHFVKNTSEQSPEQSFRTKPPNKGF